MLKRKATNFLNNWKSGKRKSLIITGARQVGKTFTVRMFAKEKYETFYELNFLENPELKTIFSGSLEADLILQLVRTYYADKPYVEGSTLIFLDEVQECPEAITALKFLSKDSRFDVIASGSALGMAFNQVTSFPVGYVDYLDLTALDFEEFLWAKGIEPDIIDSLSKHYVDRTKVHDALHVKFLSLLNEYLILGGMPEVLQVYVDTFDYVQADAVQRRLHRDYISDIARFADPNSKIKSVSCYKSIPQQLSKENRKFQYGIVEKGGTARKFESSVDWLDSAHFTVTANNVSKIEYPPEHFAKDNNFKLYTTDIGMLIAMYDVRLKAAVLMERDIESQSGNLLLRTAKGGLYEALAADFLYKKGYDKLYFYRNDSGTVEMEFLLPSNDGLIPLEIKAGRNATPSLNRILESYDVPYGIKFSSQNVGVSGKKITLPIYMMMFI